MEKVHFPLDALSFEQQKLFLEQVIPHAMDLEEKLVLVKDLDVEQHVHILCEWWRLLRPDDRYHLEDDHYEGLCKCKNEEEESDGATLSSVRCIYLLVKKRLRDVKFEALTLVQEEKADTEISNLPEKKPRLEISNALKEGDDETIQI